KKPITDLKDLRRRIRLLNGSELGDGEDEAIFSGRYQRPNYAVEKYLLRSPAGYYLPLFKLLPTKRGKTEDIILLLDERGKQEAIAEGGLADSLARAGFVVVCPDLGGFGELGNGYLESGDAYLGEIPANLWYAGILVNESLVGIHM